MDRFNITKRIGENFVTSNIEGGEFSYVQAAGSKSALMEALQNNQINHFKVDIRFLDGDFVVLVETKQQFKDSDNLQLAEYVTEEKALFPGHKIIAILANTVNDKIRVWKDQVDDEHELKKETVIDSMEHYKKIFTYKNTNNREQVQKSAVVLNEMLHAKDINEKTRSQFGGTILLYIQDVLKKQGISDINDLEMQKLHNYWSNLSAKQICSGIQETMESLLAGAVDKELKLKLTYGNIVSNQAVKNLSTADWVEILMFMTTNIYTYIDTETTEGQDILNQFFTTFNKYVGKADKNQAYTPDHIGDWMTSMLNLNKDSIIVDPTCGSGSFLVQASVKELNACCQNVTENETKNNEIKVRTTNIHGIENEEVAYGLAVTNMLLHGISTDNIKFGSTFDYFEYLINLGADAYIMNPPYNAKPKNIPEKYKSKWGASKNAKEEPTKGLVFIQLMSDVVKERNRRLLEKGLKPETAKLVVLVPVATAIGSSKILKTAKSALLKDNTLDAVFTMPDDMFYPGASVSSCCMVFTLGQPHVNVDDSVTKTFLGYFKDDHHTKRKNGGRVEIYDKNGKSMWKEAKEKWLSLYKNKETEPGLSATATLREEDEWLCEAYMDSDVSKLTKNDFLKSINNFLGSKTTYGNVLDVVNLVNALKDNKEDVKLTDTKTWRPFKVKDIFKNIEKGKCANASALADGTDIAYVGAKWKDNGVMKFCDKESNVDVINAGNCIAMIGQGQGSAGYAMYMENDFIGATSLNLGYADWINMFTGLFVSAVLCLEYDKYSFGRSWTGDRLLGTVIYLPAIEDGESYIPDFEYMEKYMKNVLF